MDFVSIDFEVSNFYSRSSACSIGIVKYKNGKLVDEFYTLINPEESFDPYCTEINGITPEMVAGKPTFDKVWKEIKNFFDKTIIIAHNASFDLSVLRHCLNKFDITFPECQYFCTYLSGKRIFPDLASYRLNYLTEHFNLPSFKHHHSLDDAKAAAEILLRLIDTTKITNLEELANKHDYKLGELFPVENTYRPFSSIRKYRYRNRYQNTLNAKEIKTIKTDFDTNHPFYKKEFVFTGKLDSMARKEAMQKVVDIGGFCGNSVTQKSNYLVIGIQDFNRLKDGIKSSKMKRAEQLAKKGQGIEIITEQEFLQMLF